MQTFLPGLEPKVRVRKPRPLTNVQVLVEVWKDIEGIRNRTKEDVAKWDKNYFARHAKVCKAMLEYLGSVEAVEDCMEKVVGFMKRSGRAYSISTVHKFMDRMAFPKNGR